MSIHPLLNTPRKASGIVIQALRTSRGSSRHFATPASATSSTSRLPPPHQGKPAAPITPASNHLFSQQAPHYGKQKPLTAGQHDTIPSLLQPYSAFPKEVSGRTVWTKEQFESNHGLWKRRWTDEQIKDLDRAYESWAMRGEQLTDINRVSGFPARSISPNSLCRVMEVDDQYTFPFSPSLTAHLLRVRDEIVHGPGFALIQGLPVNEWSREKSAAIYLAIGNVFGWSVSQNRKGHVLGHVKDLGDDPTNQSAVRIYSTTARQFFHSDDSDMVGLLCLHRALSGGESDVVSTHHLWNTLQRERPDVAELFTNGNWYYDRKGEVSKGQREWVQKAVFYWHQGRLLSNYDPYYLKSVDRFADQGLIPYHTPAQKEAIQVLEDMAQRLSLHMVLEVGDMQFVADTHVFHARTAYTDHPAPSPRRHLMRLWLSTPVREGGWSRPFPDDLALKRGGVQVDDQQETCPLEAE